MLGSAENYAQGSSRNRIAVSCVIAVLTLLVASHLHAQTVATYSFEDGTADGWSSFSRFQRL